MQNPQKRRVNTMGVRTLAPPLLLPLLLLFWLCGCDGSPTSSWKPIVGQATVAAATTTSFSVKQSHPAAGAGSIGAHADSVHSSSGIVGSALKSTGHLLHYDDGDDDEATSSAAAASLLSLEAQTAFDRFGYSYGESIDVAGHGHGGGDGGDGGAALAHTHFGGENGCAVKKYAFNGDGIAEYRNKLPELKQFTICFWTRFTNHSGDHVILTYADEHDARQLQFWIANANNSSFMSMAIKGQQVYRLNYPLRLRQWHHTCSSWNGKTGEWQVWLKAERIGRGFHNSLVGHKVPAGGKLYSGGGSPTAAVAHGLHFEITLVQVYRIALSAGKAHRDHKHHHVHTFDHNGRELSTTTRAPPAINRPLPMQSMLANGQIPTRVRINLAQPNIVGTPLQQVPLLPPPRPLQAAQLAAPAPQQPPLGAPGAYTINTNFMNGQINTGSRLLTQQVLGVRAAIGGIAAPPQALGANFNPLQSTAPQSFEVLTSGENAADGNPANVQFVDETETRFIFKRQAKHLNATAAAATTATTTRGTTTKPRATRRSTTKASAKVKRHAAARGAPDSAAASSLQKRELVLLNDGSLVDDAELLGLDLTYDGLAEFGGKQFKQDLNVKMNLADEVAEHDREPAEEEVKAVMALCSACEIEPFQGAIVFAWKEVKTQLENALKGYTVGHCGNF